MEAVPPPPSVTFPKPKEGTVTLWSREAAVGSFQDSLGPRSTIHALWTAAEPPHICRHAGTVYSHADGFCALGAPTKHSCIFLPLLGTQTLDASQKTKPQKTLAENLLWGTTSLCVVPGHLTRSRTSSTPPRLGQHNTKSLSHTGS